MSDFEDNLAEEEDGDIEVIQEPEIEQENQIGESQDNDKNDDDQAKTVVKPKKRVVRPQIKLDATRLVGPRGIGILESTFKDIKFKGKGHELEDLNKTMRVLEHWAHRLFPKMSFEDCIDKIEDLGFKKNVMVHVTKIRLGMEDELIPQPDVIDVDEPEPDPFDELLKTIPDAAQPPPLTEEQKARIARNRLIAEEIRMRKIQEKQAALAKAQAVRNLMMPFVSMPLSPMSNLGEIQRDNPSKYRRRSCESKDHCSVARDSFALFPSPYM